MTRAQCIANAAYYAHLAFWCRSWGADYLAREMTLVSDWWRAHAERH